MKKLIGIILAVCMLGTIAFATDAAVSPITGTATPVKPNADAGITGYSIAVRYAGLASTAQATMLAYDVTSVANATEKTPFDAKTTPIVGIDQEPADKTFEIKLPDTFMDSIAAGASRKIVVKVGGTDINVPMSWLVTFTKPAVTPGPGEGGEGGEGGETPVDPPVNPPVNPDEIEITVDYGDVNGDGKVNSSDASLILQKSVGILPGGAFKDQEERKIPDTVGDVNGDTKVNSSDASLILQKSVGILPGGVFKDQEEQPLIKYTYVISVNN